MEKRKNALWPASIGQFLENFKHLFLGFLLAVVVLAGFNFGGEIRVEAALTAQEVDKIAIKIQSGDTFGRVVVINNIYRGIINCYDKSKTAPDIGDWFNRSTVEQFDGGCVNFILAGETVGQPYKGSNKIINTQGGAVKPIIITGPNRLYGFEGGYVLQNNSNSTTKSLTVADIQTVPGCNNVLQCVNDPNKAQLIINKFAPDLATNVSAGRALKNHLSSGENPLIEAEAVAKNISDAQKGIVCKAYVDSDKNPVYRCRDKDNKPVGPRGEALPSSCEKSTQGDILFRYNDNTITCNINTASQDAIIANSEDDRSINVKVGKEGPLDELGAILYKIVLWVLAWLLLMIGNAGFFILWALGGFVLWILAQNPGTPAFVDLLSRPWGLLVGIGNLMVLGAFLYTGFGYLLGIGNMKKDLGEFIQKIIYYALILNFTLFGLATLVNVGYGLGNLIKVSYGSSANKEDINRQLVGNLLNGIGRISEIRCGTHTPDCVPVDEKTGKDIQTNEAKQQFDSLFGINNGTPKNEAGALTAIIMEFVAIGMMIVAGIVLWRALYTTFYRFIGILFIMMLSPIGAASLFSPIESWQSIGKQMWDKFWKMVAFYPAFIFGLILVNLLASQFVEVNRQNQAIGADTLEGALGGLLIKIVGAGISIMGLWLITDYFAKSFEEDMNKIGSGIKSVATSAWEGAQKIGRFGNGALKLGGGTIANAGRLLSTGTNFATKGFFKSRADAIAGQTKKLADMLESGLDENGNKLTDFRREGIIKNIELKKRQENTWRDYERLGLGKRFIEAGNTIGYSGDRAVSTAKNIAGYIGKMGQGFKDEDSAYWETQMNRAVKRIPGLSDDVADMIFSGAANVGIGSEAEKALARKAAIEGRANPFDNVISDTMEEARKKGFGLTDRKIRRDQAQELIPYIINKAQGDLAKLNTEEKRLLETLIAQSADDELLGRQLFGNIDGKDLVQQMDNKGLIAGATSEKLAEKWANTLGDPEKRALAGAALANSEQRFRDADKAQFNDSEVIRGYLEAGGDFAKLNKETGGLGNVYTPQTITSAKDFVENRSPLTNPEAKKKMQEARRILTENGYQAALSTQQEVARIMTEEGLTEKERNDKLEKAFADGIQQELGIDDKSVQNLDLALKAIDNETDLNKLLADSNVGAAIQSDVTGFDTMSKDAQLALVKHNLKERAYAIFKTRTGFEEEAKVVGKTFTLARQRAHKAADVYGVSKQVFTKVARIGDQEKMRAIMSGDSAKIVAAAKGDAGEQKRLEDLARHVKTTFGMQKTVDMLNGGLGNNDKKLISVVLEKFGVAPGDIAAVTGRILKKGRTTSAKQSIAADLSHAMAIIAAKGDLSDSSDESKVAQKILTDYGMDPTKAAVIYGNLTSAGGNKGDSFAEDLNIQGSINALASKAEDNANKLLNNATKEAQKLNPNFDELEGGFVDDRIELKL